MAQEPTSTISYTDGCGDCGVRQAQLPASLPGVGDDFDWDIRDYDGFRLFMLEELAARFPERRSWTPADMEVVLVETLAVVLDQLSDMVDRVQAESFLETARRPDTVRRLLAMIGYDAVAQGGLSSVAELEQQWLHYPHLMEQAKKAGPRAIHQQQRMVTLADYRDQLIGHPLVLDVDANSVWTGAWNTHTVVVRLINNLLLDDVLSKEAIAEDPETQEENYQRFVQDLAAYYQQQGMAKDEAPAIEGHSSRYLLRHIVDRQRMVGQEVQLHDAVLVGVVLALSIRISGDYFRSEINDEVTAALLDPLHGFFAPGRLVFGEDVVASDIIEVIMALDGVESICLNRMKRIGAIYADQSGSGRIVLQAHEVAVLENDATRPERGSLRITLHGGKPG